MIFHPISNTNKSNINLNINGFPITWTNNFNFLGINVDTALNFKDHIAKITTKLSKTVGVLNRLKNIVPRETLLILYNSLFVPHMSYGILSWGYKNIQQLYKIQKKAVRIIERAKYNAHTDPIFKELNIIKIHDLVKLNELKLYYKFKHDMLPHYISNSILVHMPEIHDHNTRQSQLLHRHRVKHTYATHCIRYAIPTNIVNTSNAILSKIETHSIQGYTNYAKHVLINQYITTCTIPNCYICSSNVSR